MIAVMRGRMASAFIQLADHVRADFLGQDIGIQHHGVLVGIIALGALSLEDGNPETVYCLGLGKLGKHFARPCLYGNTCDAPGISSKVHSISE